MKKFLSLTLLSAFFFSAQAQADFYGSFGLGASFNNGSIHRDGFVTTYKDTPAYSFAAGYELPLALTDVRAEVEYLRIRPNAKHGETSKFDALMLNGYVDIPLVPFVDPYVGLGLGQARYEHTNTTPLQAMLGVDYELPFMPLTLSGEYRYLKITENGGGRNETAKFHSNILMFKLRYEF